MPKRVSRRNPPTVAKNLQRAYRFFAEEAGGIVGENAKGAYNLAQAEAWASARGVTFVWKPDLDADRSWEEDAKYDGPGEYELVVATDPESGEIAALGGIVDASTKYRRVVEAELAMELKDQVGE